MHNDVVALVRRLRPN